MGQNGSKMFDDYANADHTADELANEADSLDLGSLLDSEDN